VDEEAFLVLITCALSRRWRKPASESTHRAKHVFLSNGPIRVVIPRNNPVDAYTMAAIVRDAGLTIEQFKQLL
jgi:hypothetical protein